MKTFNQSLIIRMSKSKKEAYAIVFVRITVDNKRIEFSTGLTCNPAKWNPSTSRLHGKTEEVKSFNAYMQAIEHRIYEIHRELISSGLPGKAIKETFRG